MSSSLNQFDNLNYSVDNNDLYPMLGELRKEVLRKISGNEKRVPDSEEIKNWILSEYQNNSLVGDIYRGILCVNQDYLLKENELPSLEECKQSIRDLEEKPLSEFCFISSFLDGKSHGALIQREELEVGGLIYSITIFSRENPIDTVSRVEIRAFDKEPEPFASIFCTTNGWVSISKEEIHLEKTSTFALQCLIGSHRFRYGRIPIDSIIDKRTIKPRPNHYLINLIKEALLNKVQCYKVKVPFTLIKPRDLDYALSVPEEIIKSFIDEIIISGHSLSELLLYEKDGVLIMDDDYVAYLSYYAMEIEIVTAVIVGKFKQPQVEVLLEGKGEMIRPIRVAKINNFRPVKKNKEELLKEKLSFLTPKITEATRLENKFIQFCKLLDDDSILEKELHQFLKANPQIIDSHIASIYCEVVIGKYRADIVLRYEQVDKKAVLIELERHSDKIFTKSNRLRKKVTHASQQVEDWINEIRLDSENIPNWLKSQYNPEGFVVIGRSKYLSIEQKQILKTINSNRVVKILTYDDLLVRLKNLMNMLNKLL